MYRSFARLVSAIRASLGLSTSHANHDAKPEQPLEVVAGDVIVEKGADGWKAIRILAVDAWPDGSAAAHCLMYSPVASKPTLTSLKQADVFAQHAPIDAANFNMGWERIGNQAPAEDELAGFVYYLKLTDFPRYLEFTGLDLEALTQKAKEHYLRAYALGTENKRKEAIAEYGLAVELFPFFYEAIDNRALTYMELGEHRAAVSDFEESLRVNPNGITAFFSKGECLMKLGDLKAARAIFKEGKTRFPEKRALFDDFLRLAQRMT
jgi:tetratricopeptide (TPR) repeat protein